MTVDMNTVSRRHICLHHISPTNRDDWLLLAGSHFFADSVISDVCDLDDARDASFYIFSLDLSP